MVSLRKLTTPSSRAIPTCAGTPAGAGDSDVGRAAARCFMVTDWNWGNLSTNSPCICTYMYIYIYIIFFTIYNIYMCVCVNIYIYICVKYIYMCNIYIYICQALFLPENPGWPPRNSRIPAWSPGLRQEFWNSGLIFGPRSWICTN